MAYTQTVSGQERDQLGRRLSREYVAGKTIRALATENDLSYGLVHRLLHEQETQMRGVGTRFYG